MKKLFPLLTLVGALLLTGLLTGCAEAPTAKVDEVQAAFTAATDQEANVYVADQFTAAQDSFAAAQAEIEVQNGKFALTRDYSRAEALLQSAADLANASVEQVAAKKEEVRVQADSLILQAQTAVAEAQALLARAPRGKEGEVALVSIREDAGSAEGMVNEAIAAQGNGEYMKALDLARAAVEKANALIAEMNTAIEKTRS